MNFFLLTLLIIALAVTGVGVILSSEPGTAQRAFYLSISQVKHWCISIKRYVIAMRQSGNWSNVRALLDVRTLFGARSRERMSWLGIGLVSLSLFLILMAVSRPLSPQSASMPPEPKPGTLSVLPPNQANILGVPEVKATPEAKAVKVNASKAVKRISQVVPDQYDSYEDFETWYPSACSAASMAVVLNAYGEDLRIADVLQTAIDVNAISSDLGLLEPAGIDRTVEEYDFKTEWLERGDVDGVLEAANDGKPVIVNFGPQPDWPGGHILVVTGSDENNIYLADSSEYDIQAMSYGDFSRQFTSFAVVVTPE